jgi:transmembrane sensor
MKPKTGNSNLNRQILAEAADWFVDFRVGDVDAVARERFDEWLRRSPEHIRAYWEVAKTYVELPSSTETGKLDVGALIAYARSDGNVVSLKAGASADGPRAGPESVSRVGTPIRTPRWRSRRFVAAAACTTVAILATLLWWRIEQYPLYATDIGERRSLTLADGSTVDLNARSSIRVEFSSSERRVELLDGQVLFRVANDPQRPFIVRSGDATVRVIGTEFNVYRKSSGTTVTVLEGRVAAGLTDPSGGAPVLLSAGEQVTVTPTAVPKPHPADLAATTAWVQRRQMVFDGTKLADVVEEFNLYNRRQLMIESATLSDLRVSGVYSSTDPASLLRFLREQPGIRIIETDTEVRISSQ